MTLEEFRQTLQANRPPAGIAPALVALWHDARGDWEKAHNVAQDIESSTGAWVHAYLHRKEGDHSNAGYWYRRAGQPVATRSLDAEWDSIVAALLAAGADG
jgi:hypothetical protein